MTKEKKDEIEKQQYIHDLPLLHGTVVRVEVRYYAGYSEEACIERFTLIYSDGRQVMVSEKLSYDTEGIEINELDLS